MSESYENLIIDNLDKIVFYLRGKEFWFLVMGVFLVKCVVYLVFVCFFELFENIMRYDWFFYICYYYKRLLWWFYYFIYFLVNEFCIMIV